MPVDELPFQFQRPIREQTINRPEQLPGDTGLGIQPSSLGIETIRQTPADRSPTGFEPDQALMIPRRSAQVENPGPLFASDLDYFPDQQLVRPQIELGVVRSAVFVNESIPES